ncbi:MAG: DUF2497 domain-containing protein [Bdellovibrionales bacterium]
MSDAEAPDGQEPSMEEILASIRRIIADEKDPEEAAEAHSAAPVEEDVLDLTQEVMEDGSVGEIDLEDNEPEPELEPELDPEPEVVSEPEPESFVELPSVEPDEPLVSDAVMGAAASSLSELANTVEIERRAAGMSSSLGNGSRTLESMVMELMRPLLKTWLDANLPPLVERAVQKEVARIAKRLDE